MTLNMTLSPNTVDIDTDAERIDGLVVDMCLPNKTD